MIVHTRGDPLAIAPRVREVATAVDPTLHIDKLDRMDKFGDSFLWFIKLWMKMTIGLTAITLLLSLAGIYSVLAYTVARRTREIGVRVALGASSRRIITSVFRRPLIQVTGGVMTGMVLVTAAMVALQKTEQFGGVMHGISVGDVLVLIAYAIVMLGVCALACVVPTWRALRVQPTEALRAE
jgi:ABC-type antimicrobial peptide transport system permease subunit